MKEFRMKSILKKIEMVKQISLIQKIVFICNGDCCMKAGADENTLALRACIKENQLDKEIHTVRTRCMGQCKTGPIVFITPDNVWYKGMNPELSKKIVTSHLMNNQHLQSNVLFADENSRSYKPINRKKLKNVFDKFFRFYNIYF